MKRITAINPDGTTNTSFNGSVGPVAFQNGVVELHTDEHDAYVAYCAVNVQFKVEDLDDEPAPQVDPEDLKGKALDEALEAAGLVKTGSADEKRARLAEHEQLQAQIAELDAKDVDELNAYADEFGVDLGELDEHDAIVERLVEHFTGQSKD